MQAMIHYQTKRGAGIGKPVPLDRAEAELMKFARRKQEAFVELNGEEIGRVDVSDCHEDGVLWYVYMTP